MMMLPAFLGCRASSSNCKIIDMVSHFYRRGIACTESLSAYSTATFTFDNKTENNIKLSPQKKPFYTKERRDIKAFKKEMLHRHHDSLHKNISYSLKNVFIVMTSTRKKDHNPKFDENLPAEIRNMLAHRYVVASSLQDKFQHYQNREWKTSFEEYFEKGQSEEEPNPVEIPNRKLNAEEWRKILENYEKFGLIDYSLNIRMQAILDFLLATNVPVDIEENDIRQRDKWHKSTLVKSFIDFILKDEQCLPVCQPTVKKYIAYCSSKDDTREVMRVYKKVKANHSVLSPYFASAVASALTKTDKHFDEGLRAAHHNIANVHLWKPHITITKRSIADLNTIAIGALQTGRYELALNVTAVLGRRSVDHNCISTALVKEFLKTFSYCEDAAIWKRNRQVVEAFFLVMGQQQKVLLDVEQAKVVSEWFKSNKEEEWIFEKLNISGLRRAFCPITGVPLAPARLTSSEFDILKGIVLQVIMKKVFQNTHMQTLAGSEAGSDRFPLSDSMKQFLEYIMVHGPFNIVIDGLNVIFHCKIRSDTSEDRFDEGFSLLGRLIQRIKKQSRKENLKILIPLRSHMEPFVERNKRKIDFENVHICYVHNHIADDTVLLYASICSGPNCYYLSMDLFRDYKQSIADYLGYQAAFIFYKYQRSRQITLSVKKDGSIIIQPSNVVDSKIQQTDGSVWHFPYLTGDDKGRYATNWLCIYKD